MRALKLKRISDQLPEILNGIKHKPKIIICNVNRHKFIIFFSSDVLLSELLRCVYAHICSHFIIFFPPQRWVLKMLRNMWQNGKKYAEYFEWLCDKWFVSIEKYNSEVLTIKYMHDIRVKDCFDIEFSAIYRSYRSVRLMISFYEMKVIKIMWQLKLNW